MAAAAAVSAVKAKPSSCARCRTATQPPPAADLSYPSGSAPACREVSLVLNLATNADGVEDPQPIFDYAATGACAAIDE